MHAKLSQISQDPAALSAAVREGEKAASVCRNCHGASGNSTMPDARCPMCPTWPARLGAQGIEGKKLYSKLCIACHGASGSGERNDPKMVAYTRNLKDADIQNLAAFLSTLQP